MIEIKFNMKLLFICTLNLQRSPTAEKIFIGGKGGNAVTSKYPLPIDATVEVRVECDACAGEGGEWDTNSQCYECTEGVTLWGKGTIDTLLRLKTSEPPWVTSWYALNRDVEIDGICLNKIEGGHTMVASYVCKVVKVDL